MAIVAGLADGEIMNATVGCLFGFGPASRRQPQPPRRHSRQLSDNPSSIHEEMS